MALFNKKKGKQRSKKKPSYNKDKVVAFSKKTIEIDWLILLVGFVLTLLLVIGWSFTHYLDLQDQENQIENNIVSGREIINSKKLNRVVSKYTGRTTRFEKLIRNFEFTAVREKRRILEERLNTEVEVAPPEPPRNQQPPAIGNGTDIIPEELGEDDVVTSTSTIEN